MRNISTFIVLLAVVMLAGATPDGAFAAKRSTVGDPGKPTLGTVSCKKKFNGCKESCWSDLRRCENQTSPYGLPRCVDALQRCLNRCKKKQDSCRNRTGAGSIRAMKGKSGRRTTKRNTMDKRSLRRKKRDRDG